MHVQHFLQVILKNNNLKWGKYKEKGTEVSVLQYVQIPEEPPDFQPALSGVYIYQNRSPTLLYVSHTSYQIRLNQESY